MSERSWALGQIRGGALGAVASGALPRREARLFVLMMFTVFALLSSGWARADEEQVRRAERLQRDNPAPGRALGIVELRRAAGVKSAPPRDFEKPSPARD